MQQRTSGSVRGQTGNQPIVLPELPVAKLRAKPSTLKRIRRLISDNVFVAFAPLVILTVIAAYLILSSPSDSASPVASTAKSADDDGRVIEVSMKSVHCSPMQLIDDSVRHYKLVRCAQSITCGEWHGIHTTISIAQLVLASAALALPQRPVDASPYRYLLFGLRCGHVATMFHDDFGMIGDVVEWNDDLIEWAVEIFGFNASGNVYLTEPTRFMQQLTQEQLNVRYDIIALDTFDSQSLVSVTSSELYSLEAYQLLRSLLTENGIIIINYMSYRTGIHSRAPHSVYRTLRAVFPHVRIFSDGEQAAVGYITLMASQKPIVIDTDRLKTPPKPLTDEEADAEDESALAQRFRHSVWKKQARWEMTFTDTDSPVRNEKGDVIYTPSIIRREYNPLPDWQVIAVEKSREQERKLFPFL